MKRYDREKWEEPSETKWRIGCVITTQRKRKEKTKQNRIVRFMFGNVLVTSFKEQNRYHVWFLACL